MNRLDGITTSISEVTDTSTFFEIVAHDLNAQISVDLHISLFVLLHADSIFN